MAIKLIAKTILPTPSQFKTIFDFIRKSKIQINRCVITFEINQLYL